MIETSLNGSQKQQGFHPILAGSGPGINGLLGEPAIPNPQAAWLYFTSHPQVSPSSELLCHRYGVIAAFWLAGRRWAVLDEIALE